MENKYDKYKDSGIEWIGEIPEHWEINKLFRVFDLKARVGWKGLQSSEFEEKSYAYLVTGQDFRGSQIDWSICYQINKERYDEDPYIQLKNDDILITKDGTIGKVAIVSNLDKPACLNSGIFVMRKRNNQFITKYIYWLFASSLLKSYNDDINSGASTIVHLYQRTFYQMPLPIPSFLEQQAIATYLDQKCGEIDELIALQEEMITKLQSYKQSVITEAVTKGLDKNVPLKDSGIEWIGEIPEHWSKNKIIRLFTIIGSGTTPKSSKEDNYNGSINWIQSGDINGGYIETCKNTISDTAFKEYPALKIYKAPFIIVAMYGASVGNISISQIDGCVNQACCVMNETNQNFKYLFYAMNSVKRYLIYRAEGGGQPNISQDKIKNTWLPIPPLPEQQSIADYLDQKCGEIDKLISIKQQKIEKLKDYKKSLIFECVTGKRKVC